MILGMIIGGVSRILVSPDNLENESEKLMIYAALSAMVVGAIALIWWLTSSGPKCPKCDNRKPTVLSKDPQRSRYFEYPGGGPGGGGVSVQLEYKVRYVCNNCGHHWSQIITETS